MNPAEDGSATAASTICGGPVRIVHRVTDASSKSAAPRNGTWDCSWVTNTLTVFFGPGARPIPSGMPSNRTPR
jgi:hypothetical protein